jgi:hypothetical protein
MLISFVENFSNSLNFTGAPIFLDLYAAKIILTAKSPASPSTSGSLFSSRASTKSLYNASCP